MLGECLGLDPELLETGAAPFTAAGSGCGVENATGILKRHESWDLFVNINIELSKKWKREGISMKEQKICKKQTNKHYFLIGLCIF